MAHAAEPRAMKISHQEMVDARVEIAFRDYCAHLLVPLNKCREATLWMPWKCTDERHAYEKCQYEEYLWREEQMRLRRVDEEVARREAEGRRLGLSEAQIEAQKFRAELFGALKGGKPAEKH
eukprot:tig00000823_g4541.t1